MNCHETYELTMEEGVGGGRGGAMLHLLNCQQSGEKSAKRAYNWEFQKRANGEDYSPWKCTWNTKRRSSSEGSTPCLTVCAICMTCSISVSSFCPEQNLQHKSPFAHPVQAFLSWMWWCEAPGLLPSGFYSANALIGFL